MNVQLNLEKDNFVWSLTNSGEFTVKSLYLDLLNDDTKYLKKYIGKIKVPLKIKVFMWFLHRKEILTKDNLIKRSWTGNDSCCFCDNKESIQHLFFECPFAKIEWRIIFMTFGLAPPKNITNLLEIGSRAFRKRNSFLSEWEYVQLFGLCGTREMILYLTNQKHLHSCRLFPWLPTGSVRGSISNKRSSK
jgi:hypothetical protein